MAKIRTKYVCQSCGYETSKWMGKCPECMKCNSFVEEVEEKKSKKEVFVIDKSNSKPVSINSIVAVKEERFTTSIDELDRVLGGGLVKGSLVLLGGEPGIGKSTLILQLCNKLKGEGKVLYVSGEESAEQIKLRADRLEINNDDILFLGETDIDLIAKEGIDLEYGARPLKRAIQNHLENELSELILQRTIKTGDTVVASAKDDKMVFRVK